MKRALTVDLWDTLIYDEPHIDAARRDLRLAKIGRILERACGYDFEKTRDRMLAAYETSWQWLEQTWQTGQEIVPSAQMEMYLRILFSDEVPRGLPENELLQAYLEPILDHPPFAMPGAREILVQLKRKGWKLGLISNTGRTSGVFLRRVLQKQKVFELFDAFSFSDELGLRKPNPVIFEKTMKELEASPANSFHLGDNWEADIQGAQKAGLLPLWFCRNGARGPDPSVRQIKNWPELKFLLQS